MPIVDVELVCASNAEVGHVSARALADALGEAFASPPGHTWVRLHLLDSQAYAENGVTAGTAGWPVFVTVLQACPPTGRSLAIELAAVTHAVARCTARQTDLVHVQYAAPGAGRQAFGGRIVE